MTLLSLSLLSCTSNKEVSHCLDEAPGKVWRTGLAGIAERPCGAPRFRVQSSD